MYLCVTKDIANHCTYNGSSLQFNFSWVLERLTTSSKGTTSAPREVTTRKMLSTPPQKKKLSFFLLKTQIENREEMDIPSSPITTSASSDVAASLYKKTCSLFGSSYWIDMSICPSIYLYIIIAHPSTRCVNNINKLSITWIKSICRSIMEQRTRGVQTWKEIKYFLIIFFQAS